MITFKLHDYLSKRHDTGVTMLETVMDKLPTLANRGWIAGGAVRDTLNGDGISSDIDLFFKNKIQLDSFKRDMERMNYKVSKTTDNYTLYKVKVDDYEFDVQLIHKSFYDSSDDLLDSFDFTICQFAVNSELIVTAGDFSLYDLARKRLILHKVSFGVSTVRRLIKYSKKGFYACAGTITDILREVTEDPSKINETVISLD